MGRHHKADRLAPLLQSSGASGEDDAGTPATASPGITMSIYAKAVTADKRHAQEAIAALFVGNSNQRQTQQQLRNGHAGTVYSFVFPNLFLFGLCYITKLLK